MKRAFYKMTFGLLVTASTAFGQVPTSGLVAYYPFNGNANDASGNGNNGTVNGATLTIDRFGKANSAYSFNRNFKGTSDYISVRDNNNFHNSQFTISCWLYCDEPQTGGEFFSKNDNFKGFEFAYKYFGSSGLYCYIGDGTWYATQAQIDNNKWVLFTYTYDGSVAKIYINSTLVTTNNIGITPAYGTGEFNFGKFSTSSNSVFFVGNMDDIAIYNRALTAQEIAQLYQGCTSTTSSTTQSACSSYTWNGTTYTSSGTYTKTGLKNKAGCDSTATLNLTIKKPSTSTTAHSACVSYTWNGTTYTATGTYTKTGLKNKVGCDSTATLNLTINPTPIKPFIGSYPFTVCLGSPYYHITTAEVATTYTWKRDGVKVGGNAISYLVDQGGKYTLTVANQFGCENTSDSVLIISFLPAPKPVISGKEAFCAGGNTVLSTTFKSKKYNWKKGTDTLGVNAKQITLNTAGTYSLTVIDSNGCSVTSDSKVISVNPLPTVSFTGLPSTISTQSAKVTLVGSPTGGTFSGLGVTGSQLDSKVGKLGNRTISYSYTNASNCSNIAKQTVMTFDTVGNYCSVKDTLYIKTTIITGTSEGTVENTMKIYPNPASDHLIIENNRVTAMSGHSVQVLDMQGKTVFSSAINQAQFSINLANWTKNSVYFVKLLNAQNTVVETKKVIVQ